MKLSFNWLKNYVNLPGSITPEEVAQKLKMSTVEVEGIEKPGALLENVVVGKVLKAEKHPNADKLKVCEVDLGSERVTIVCGGSNVQTGMLVAVAKNGAKVKWHGEGDLIELKPATIRGIESNGMICGADEIGLVDRFPKKDEKEIVDLSSMKLKAGTPLAEALGLNDAVLEVDNKSLSNRPDLWGHYGMAREVAVLFNREVGEYKTKEIGNKKQEIKVRVTVEDAKLCSRYMAVAMGGIKVQESPAWLKEKLVAVGLRPINNIVDITNYVMFDLGQPMHAFDARRISKSEKENNKHIMVRCAKDGEKFVTLDEKEHTLTSEMVVIADDDRALALAGIMGGLESGIASDTANIIFESANFDAATVRKTSTKLGIRTDSSARFEKSLDPNLAETALKRAVELVLELCPEAKVVSKVVDEGKPRLFTGPLEVPIDFFKQKIGVEIPVKTIVTTLQRLGFTVEEKSKVLKIKIPTWRATKDISIPEDIVEEVVRIYGYDNIPSSLPAFPITPHEKNALRELEWKAVDALVRDLGYNEVYNYSFVSGQQIAAFGDDVSKYIELDNPLSKEKPYLRRHLVFNLVDNILKNGPEHSDLKLFEIGKKYIAEEAGPRSEANGDELLPRQDTWVCAVAASKNNKEPFFEVRRVVEVLGKRLSLPTTFVEEKELFPWDHPSRIASVEVAGSSVGTVYELHPGVAEKLGLDRRVGVCVLNLSAISSMHTQKSVEYRAIPAYPEVRRDLALLVTKDKTNAALTSSIISLDPLIKNVELFDVYEGKNIGEGYKSMAYHITYGSNEKTLTTEEVDKVQSKVEDVLKNTFGAEVRR